MKQTNETWTKNRKELQAHTKKNYPIPNEKAHEIERKKKNTEHTARVWFKRRITKHVFTMVAMSTEIRSINTPWAAAGFFFGVVFFLVSLSLSLVAEFFFLFKPLVLLLRWSFSTANFNTIPLLRGSFTFFTISRDSTTQFTMFQDSMLRFDSFGSLIVQGNESVFFCCLKSYHFATGWKNIYFLLKEVQVWT